MKLDFSQFSLGADGEESPLSFLVFWVFCPLGCKTNKNNLVYWRKFKCPKPPRDTPLTEARLKTKYLQGIYPDNAEKENICSFLFIQNCCSSSLKQQGIHTKLPNFHQADFDVSLLLDLCNRSSIRLEQEMPSYKCFPFSSQCKAWEGFLIASRLDLVMPIGSLWEKASSEGNTAYIASPVHHSDLEKTSF